jgi:hypothetical protein
MPKLIDLTGERFGRLIVMQFNHSARTRSSSSRPYWRCRCDCGNIKIVAGHHLKSCKIQSCGCIRSENTTRMKTTHGHSKTSIYKIWTHMNSRCFKRSYNRFHRYGGRGITVCDRWRRFENFLEDMGSSWFKGASIERKNVDGNYEPSNCIWIPLCDQSKNRRTTIMVDSPWGRMNAMYVAKLVGISPGAMYERIHTWPKERWCEPKH